MTKTPLRRALREDSLLVACIADGLGAVKIAHRGYFDPTIRSAFADSLDLDEALSQGHEQENRWDYLLGYAPTREVVAVEPHSAKQDEITTVINKRFHAREQLKDHLRAGARITKWLWVASGRVHFADTEKARRRLDQHGIEFVGRRVELRHLPSAVASDSRALERRAKRKR
ncbi:MAG: hypothetical protein WA210_21475 [Burkholderiaceae bacterium]